MAKLLERRAQQDPNRPALIDAAGSRSWGELNARVNRLINGSCARSGRRRPDRGLRRKLP
jgi:acyl-CoA synthetase (AMP-forming)/AMP-acid ligase II